MSTNKSQLSRDDTDQSEQKGLLHKLSEKLSSPLSQHKDPFSIDSSTRSEGKDSSVSGALKQLSESIVSPLSAGKNALSSPSEGNRMVDNKDLKIPPPPVIAMSPSYRKSPRLSRSSAASDGGERPGLFQQLSESLLSTTSSHSHQSNSQKSDSGMNSSWTSIASWMKAEDQLTEDQQLAMELRKQSIQKALEKETKIQLQMIQAMDDLESSLGASLSMSRSSFVAGETLDEGEDSDEYDDIPFGMSRTLGEGTESIRRSLKQTDTMNAQDEDQKERDVQEPTIPNGEGDENETGNEVKSDQDYEASRRRELSPIDVDGEKQERNTDGQHGTIEASTTQSACETGKNQVNPSAIDHARNGNSQDSQKDSVTQQRSDEAVSRKNTWKLSSWVPKFAQRPGLKDGSSEDGELSPLSAEKKRQAEIMKAQLKAMDLDESTIQRQQNMQQELVRQSTHTRTILPESTNHQITCSDVEKECKLPQGIVVLHPDAGSRKQNRNAAQLLALFAEEKIPRTVLDASDATNREQRDILLEKSNTRDYPQIFKVAGQSVSYLGGLEEIRALCESGEMNDHIVGSDTNGQNVEEATHNAPEEIKTDTVESSTKPKESRWKIPTWKGSRGQDLQNAPSPPEAHKVTSSEGKGEEVEPSGMQDSKQADNKGGVALFSTFFGGRGKKVKASEEASNLEPVVVEVSKSFGSSHEKELAELEDTRCVPTENQQDITHKPVEPELTVNTKPIEEKEAGADMEPDEERSEELEKEAFKIQGITEEGPLSESIHDKLNCTRTDTPLILTDSKIRTPNKTASVQNPSGIPKTLNIPLGHVDGDSRCRLSPSSRQEKRDRVLNRMRRLNDRIEQARKQSVTLP